MSFNNLRKISSNGMRWTEPKKNIHIEPRRRAVAGGANMRKAIDEIVNYILALSTKNFKNNEIRQKVRMYLYKKYFTGAYPARVVNKRSGLSINTAVPFPRFRNNNKR
jgi:GTPase SAR1 family protein